MRKAIALLRPWIAGLLLACFIYLLWKSQQPDAQIQKLTSLAIVLVTGVYAIFTFEILIENRSMAAAARASAHTMQQTLRFSLAPNLVFSVIVTKNPTLVEVKNCRPYANDDHRRALKEFAGTGEQMEFVYGLVRNIGKGPASKLTVSISMNVRNPASVNPDSRVDKNASIQSLEPESAIAICVYISKTPAAERMVILAARITSSDMYRDANSESPSIIEIKPQDIELQRSEDCILSLS